MLLFAFIWLAAELVIIFALGLGNLNGAPFKLPDSVAIAILTTAAATVLGLFAIFLRWLYPGREEK